MINYLEPKNNTPRLSLEKFDAHKGHMQDWIREMIQHDKSKGIESIQRSNDFFMDRKETYARLEGLGLPTVPHACTSLTDFLKRPKQYLADFKGLQVRLVVEPNTRKEELPTVRLTNPQKEQIGVKLRETIPNEARAHYSVLIKEFIPFAYQATIMVNKDQSIDLEATSPTSKSIQLNGEPEYQVRRDPMLFTYRYNFEDPALRQLLYRTILKVPHVGSGRERIFTPGYYELIIAKRSEDTPFQVFFDDYRTGKGFSR
ncbi:MAG: hypothetical protein KDD62_02835 [Bdellovibrionales bacterium]|nr:hypothetical protein [Bdellovibrionales bacterium]